MLFLSVLSSLLITVLFLFSSLLLTFLPPLSDLHGIGTIAFNQFLVLNMWNISIQHSAISRQIVIILQQASYISQWAQLCLYISSISQKTSNCNTYLPAHSIRVFSGGFWINVKSRRRQKCLRQPQPIRYLCIFSPILPAAKAAAIQIKI